MCRFLQLFGSLARDKNASAVDKKLEHVRAAVEDGLNDAAWANSRLEELFAERAAIISRTSRLTSPPQTDTELVMEYRRQAAKLFKEGLPAERKRLLRALVKEVVLEPEKLEVAISYRLPEPVMKGLVAGGGFEPPTFGL